MGTHNKRWVGLLGSIVSGIAGLGASTTLLHADEVGLVGEAQCANNVCVTEYDPAFFSQYAPITALDMVNNLPGFTIQNGASGTRGFDATTGNVLLNGKRASSKSESASDQLSIIPADDVLRIQLLQGQLSSYDLVGQTLAVNVIRKSSGATGTVTLEGRMHQPSTAVRPFVGLSYSSKLGDFDYTASLDLENYQRRRDALETVTNGRGEVIEIRDETFDESGDRVATVFNASGYVNDIRINTNFAAEYTDEFGGEVSRRTPTIGLDQPFDLTQPDLDRWFDYEIGFDAQKPLTENLTGKVITLLVSSDYTEEGALDRAEQNGDSIRTSAFVFDSLSTEKILRFEFDYSGFSGHAMEFSVEGALNNLDSDFALSALVDGELTPIDVPGAKTSVEERRVDTRLTDSFKWNGIGVEMVLGAEYSKISQDGGFNAERSFFFLKPRLSLTYAFDQKRQVQVRMLRDVGQLNFFDFTSATDLGDVELQLGNPELEPERTTTLDIRYEHRTEGISAFTGTLFYDWIDDVADIVPVNNGLEVPGNIGAGERYGIRSDFTLALDRFWLRNARLDAGLRWQRSSVTDPLTMTSRPLSREEGWDVRINVRQDLDALNLAWGITYFADANIPEFGLDERIGFDKERGWNFFIEKRQWYGFRARLSVDNAFWGGRVRDRIVHNGPRHISPILFREFRDLTFARQLSFTLSKTF